MNIKKFLNIFITPGPILNELLKTNKEKFYDIDADELYRRFLIALILGTIMAYGIYMVAPVNKEVHAWMTFITLGTYSTLYLVYYGWWHTDYEFRPLKKK